jgi:ribosomal protein S26
MESIKPQKCCNCSNPVKPDSPIAAFIAQYFVDDKFISSRFRGIKSQSITINDDNDTDGMLLEFRHAKSEKGKTDFYITCKKCGKTCIYEFEV